MKVEVKKVDPVKRELRFEVPKERVTQKLNQVYTDLGKYAKVRGYRPGKVPRNILETYHGKTAQEEMIKQLIPEVYHEGIEKEKINPLDLPEIHDVSYKDGIVTFTAKLDIKPEVKVGDYKGIKIKRKSSQVTDEEINKTLEYFKKGQGEKETPIDDAFARGLGYPSLEEFKRSLARQLEIDKDRHNRFDIESQIIEELLKKAKVQAPASLVKRQLERRVNETKERLRQQGIGEEEIKKRDEGLRRELEEAVEKDIKVYLIMDRIAQEEKIEVKENENLPSKVIEFLFKEANWEEEKAK